MRRLLILVPLFVTGCAKVAPLQPAPGHHLPVKPAMAETTPTAEQLLQPRADAAPERVDELLRKSAPRKADRFDLPPPDGGAPPLPAGATPPSNASDPAGPSTPQ